MHYINNKRSFGLVDPKDADIIALTTKINTLEGRLKKKENPKENSGSPGASNGKGKNNLNPKTSKKND
eukprot:7607549-Ditylum_brightwellii.AAC.1